MGEDPPLTAEETPISARRPATGERPQSSRRHSLDFAQRCSLATCPTNSPHRQRAGGDFETGKSKESGSPFGVTPSGIETMIACRLKAKRLDAI
jgi:hypothetical protein